VLPAPIWHVPYTRNPFFTGREELLKQIHDQLYRKHQVTVTQAPILSGLGGIGKTQAALEYAFRFRSDYQTVLWVRAETTETVLEDYHVLAELFQLPEQSTTQQSVLVAAVKQWFLAHTSWLLICDNVENPELLQMVLPEAQSGHILLTARSHSGGKLGVPVPVPPLNEAESERLLLVRARLLASDAPLEVAPPALRAEATRLVRQFDGYPLALDQAGAYIEETSCRLTDYLRRYATQRSSLLNLRGSGGYDHPESVLATLSLAFDQVLEASSEAAELLKLCAFLYADTIPEAILSLSGNTLGPMLSTLARDPLLLESAMKVLRRYSLLQRDSIAQTLSIHRLVQVVLQESMGKEERKSWIERLIAAYLCIFPSYEQAVQEGGGVQARCQPYLSHALICAELLQEAGIASEAAAEFLFRIGYYLQLYGALEQAIPLMEQAHQMAMARLGSNHERVAFYCNQLGLVYLEVNDDQHAESCFWLALAMRERALGAEHPSVAESLWPLASLLTGQGRFLQAQALAERALVVKEQALGSTHYEVGLVLNILGPILMYEGNYAQAEQILQRAQRLFEQALAPDHFFLASTKMHLVGLYYRQTAYIQAGILCQQAVELYERHLGSNHPLLASSLRVKGLIAVAEQHYRQAADCFRKSIQIYGKLLIPDRCNQALSLLYYGEVSLLQGYKWRMKQMVGQALGLLGETTRLLHPDYQDIVHALLLVGDRLVAQGRKLQAQGCYHQASTIGARALAPEHPVILQCQNRLATLFE
jgi:tetratricopeptide (TPR) repeat protein